MSDELVNANEKLVLDPAQSKVNIGPLNDPICIKQPKYAWRVEIAPKIFWYREEGQQPNVFHRMMQEMFFGFKWRKLNQ